MSHFYPNINADMKISEYLTDEILKHLQFWKPKKQSTELRKVHQDPQCVNSGSKKFG